MTLKLHNNWQIALKPLIFAFKLEKMEAKRHLLPFLESSKKVSAKYLRFLKSICKSIYYAVPNKRTLQNYHTPFHFQQLIQNVPTQINVPPDQASNSTEFHTFSE